MKRLGVIGRCRAASSSRGLVRFSEELTATSVVLVFGISGERVLRPLFLGKVTPAPAVLRLVAGCELFKILKSPVFLMMSKINFYGAKKW